MEHFIQGQKAKLSTLTASQQMGVGIKLSFPLSYTVDISCFGVDDQNQLTDDRYFIFYNQPQSPCQALRLLGPQYGDDQQFQVDLTGLPAHIQRLVFTATIDGEGTMAQLSQGHLRLLEHNTQNEIIRFSFKGGMFQQEKALILGELYLKNGWRFGAVGQGFNGGLKALLESFGGEAIEEKEEAPPPPVNISKISLLKKKVQVILEKKKLTEVVARVALVLDVTGSMRRLYKQGTVQRVVERIVAVASQFDDDGELDMWIYDHRFTRLPFVTEENVEDYVEREILTRKKIFGYNVEPPVMRDVIKKYSSEEPGKEPVFVVFITDGGFKRTSSRQDNPEKILIEVSSEPIFWQFVGLGQANYGLLKKLDDLPGRVVDNANFFALDDVDEISDEVLYDRLLNEFPLWIRAAKAKQILM